MVPIPYLNQSRMRWFMGTCNFVSIRKSNQFWIGWNIEIRITVHIWNSNQTPIGAKWYAIKTVSIRYSTFCSFGSSLIIFLIKLALFSPDEELITITTSFNQFLLEWFPEMNLRFVASSRWSTVPIESCYYIVLQRTPDSLQLGVTLFPATVIHISVYHFIWTGHLILRTSPMMSASNLTQYCRHILSKLLHLILKL